jgi:hypothetical protein
MFWDRSVNDGGYPRDMILLVLRSDLDNWEFPEPRLDLVNVSMIMVL